MVGKTVLFAVAWAVLTDVAVAWAVLTDELREEDDFGRSREISPGLRELQGRKKNELGVKGEVLLGLESTGRGRDAGVLYGDSNNWDNSPSF